MLANKSSEVVVAVKVKEGMVVDKEATRAAGE